jgi:uncharacterized protein
MSNTPLPPKLDDVLTTLARLKPYVKATWGVTELAVFGSVARNEATVDSDVDILIQANDLTVPAYLDMCEYFEQELKRPVDVLRKTALRPITWHYIQPDVRYV